MNACAAIQDDLSLLALGALDSDRRVAIRAHLATGCAGCAAALAREVATAECLRVLAGSESDAAARWGDDARRDARATLLARVSAARGSFGLSRTASRRLAAAPFASHRRFRWPLAAAAVAVVVGVIVTAPWTRQGPHEPERGAGHERVVSLLADARTPRARLMRGGDEVGVVLYDEARRQLLVFAPGLPAPTIDRVRVLWCRPKGDATKYDNLGRFESDRGTGADHVWRDAAPLSMMEAVEVSDEVDPTVAIPSRVVARAEVR